jgi:hypothetical protein
MFGSGTASDANALFNSDLIPLPARHRREPEVRTNSDVEYTLFHRSRWLALRNGRLAPAEEERNPKKL